jgi:hypothetical protein
LLACLLLAVITIEGKASPARGGKRIAIKPKKISGEHILVYCLRFESLFRVGGVE